MENVKMFTFTANDPFPSWLQQYPIEVMNYDEISARIVKIHTAFGDIIAQRGDVIMQLTTGAIVIASSEVAKTYGLEVR